VATGIGLALKMDIVYFSEKLVFTY
jgi:hypothetical protein